MKSGIALIFTLILLVPRAPPPQVWSSPLGPNKKQALSLTGTVLNKKCLDWNHNLSELRLRLRFTNGGDRPLILNKRDLEIVTIKYFAFIDKKKDEVHLGELAIVRSRGWEPAYDQELASGRPNSHFVVLAPGRSYVMEASESVPLIPSAPNSERGPNRSDEYQIEVEASTWRTMDPGLADSLRHKWRNMGALWSKTIWSEPMRFTFARKRMCEK